MADERRERDGATNNTVKNPNDRKIKGVDNSIEDGDFISSMPDEILHHILTSIPTDLAIRTSVLSKRWRHVWCETPCLYINDFRSQAINQTLNSYRAPTIMSFDLRMRLDHTAPQIDSWISFAMSRNVQKLSVNFGIRNETYNFQDFFYLSSSLEQLNVSFNDMVPGCTVSWKSLKNLSLSFCKLGDESIAKILSGSPKLESLRLYFCDSVHRLDLTKSLSLKTLEIVRSGSGNDSRQVEIIAPHIQYLRLKNSYPPCTLVNVSSLTEADLDSCSNIMYMYRYFSSRAEFVQTVVLKMLENLENVEKLTLRRSVLQILSLAEVCGVPFPTLKVQTLIVKTMLVRSVMHGIARLLQNSPGLKKLIVHATNSDIIPDMHLDHYMNSQGIYLYKCWRSEYKIFPRDGHFHHVTPELLASLVKLVLRNAKPLETVVVRLFKPCSSQDAKLFEELTGMARTLSHNNNVSIVIKRSSD
ncbi:unnamed protein product [Microthlaspi erraticum]|uniref:Uncharacterized protein n=1 Tax=Microthlaspi erraticum TaxID=1685480 RepID=A0A6D2LER3_9BRAS|nr:unnamed protein product [Microthlaspi erraticum]